MAPSEPAPAPGSVLAAIAGGYLRNPIRQDYVTCADCTTPVSGYRLCFTCNRHRIRPGLADTTAFLTYAVAGQNSGRVMRGYKARPSVPEHRLVVGLLLRLALEGHIRCPGVIASLPVTHWAIVPSLPSKPYPHPLLSLVTGHVRGTESPIASAVTTADPRAVSPSHFTCTAPLPAASHALLIDDTWTTGGHAHSAALALRNAGAARVSVLVVARWLKEDYGNNKQFLADLATRDYDPRICPWTGGPCP
jgi:predicted amidophosphoribosyltransferase